MSTRSLIHYEPGFATYVCEKFGLTNPCNVDHPLLEHVPALNRWFINKRGPIDRLKEHQFLFNTTPLIPIPEYKYHPEVNHLSIADILIEWAQMAADTGKLIELYWSGGLDSTAVLLALNEICPKQVKVIIGEQHEYPDLYEKVVKHMDHVIIDNTPKFYGYSQPDKNLLCSAAQADIVFGCMGIAYTLEDEPIKYKNVDRLGWYDTQRYLAGTNEMRFVTGFKGNWVDIENINKAPYAYFPLMQKMINYDLNDELMYYRYYKPEKSPMWTPCVPNYHRCKKQLRDAIFKFTGDKQYSYYMEKVGSEGRLTTQSILNWNASNYRNISLEVMGVLAIENNGNVIRYDNIDDCNVEELIHEFI